MRPAGVRWSENDLTKFTRNSGRGLPKETLRQMTKNTGLPMDSDGNPIPATPEEVDARAKVAETKAKMEPAKVRKRRGNKLSTKAEIKAIDKKFIASLPDHPAGKYRNTKRVRDGIKFDSILEADQYTELVFQQKAGEITYFLRQVPIHLSGGVILRVDFVTFALVPYLTAGRNAGEPMWVVRYLDTKGHQTRESKNKIKQAKHEYGITVELVKKVRKLRS